VSSEAGSSDSTVEGGVGDDGSPDEPTEEVGVEARARRDDPGSVVAELCPAYGDPQRRGSLPGEVDEASGLVVDGPADAPILWLHNDSGDLARLYAVNAEGELLTTVHLETIIAFDWEDMARGPCHEGDTRRRCLYVGDVGDNFRLRQWVTIHRVPIPETTSAWVGVVEGVETMRVRYPEGPRDCEALVVDETGRVFLLSKDRDGTFSLFSAPFEAALRPVMMEHHGTFDLSALPEGPRARVTAADFDPYARRLLVRTYNAALEYRLEPGEALQALGDRPRDFVVVPVAEERQGESIGYGAGGYWHVSEGVGAPLYHVPCERLDY
jgi:hypothetical protein